MRLIDADALKEDVLRNPEKLFAKGIYGTIDSQPTAYDVDKVVGKLNQSSQNIELIYPTDQGYDYEDGVGVELNKAIEIVKRG